MNLSTDLTAASDEPYDKIYLGIAMKSLLPNTKFKIRAQESLSQKRLQARPNRHSPPLSGSTILKDLQSLSQAAKLLGHLDQLSRERMRLYSSPVSAPPQYRLPEIPRYIFVGDQPGESEIRLGIFAGLRYYIWLSAWPGF
jgi:hypothetical protein